MLRLVERRSRRWVRWTTKSKHIAAAGQVFERVASDVVLGALDGINGTVFAYGQTGSGKTFTVTGGAARYADRGLIPRAISLVFAELRQRSDHTYAVRRHRLVRLMGPAVHMCSTVVQQHRRHLKAIIWTLPTHATCT